MINLIINIILIIAGIVGFIIQVIQLIFNKNHQKKKGFKKISNLGWWALFTAIIMALGGISGLCISYYEKKASDKNIQIKDSTYNSKIDIITTRNNGLINKIDSLRKNADNSQKNY
jgi:hypothetical protein